MRYLSHMRRAVIAAAIFTLAAFIAGCGTNDKLASTDATGDPGSINFDSYVAIGNSLTAGYQSAALRSADSEHSFPMQIAAQAGVTTFVQPEISDPGIGTYTAKGAGVLQFNPATFAISPMMMTDAQVAQFIASGGNPGFLLANATHPAPYNNLGVPGALAVEIPSATSAATSMSKTAFFDVVLRGQGTTVVQQALALSPTFATVWLGNNDILGWATSGGTAVGLPIPSANVKAAIETVVNSLVSQNACKVALANIPDVSAVPFFTTIKPYATVGSTDEPVLVDGAKQYFLGPDGALTDDDMIILTAKDSLLTGYGSTKPLEDWMVLSAAEQQTVSQTITAYNAAIQEIANANTDQVVLVDINALFQDMAAGHYYVGGVHLTPKMVTGGLFSLDGVHPNSVGYGLIANHFITAMNEKWGATIPLVNLSSLQGD